MEIIMELYTTVDNEDYKAIKPIQFGHESCNQGHYYGPAVRSFWLVHFVVSGFGYFSIGEREYNIGPGEMFVIPPDVETFYKADDENPWSYIWIGFKADGQLPMELPDVVRCPEAMETFNLIKSRKSFSSGTSAFLSARLWDLFALLLGREDASADYIEIALSCIHSEYMYDITVGQLAERIGLDRCYFSTLFKSRTGVSPKQYLLNYRMSIALSLMMDRGVSVSVAANSVGYNDVYNFSKAFKKHYDMSPSEYIKKKKK